MLYPKTNIDQRQNDTIPEKNNDEIFGQMNIINNPSEEQSLLIAEKSSQQANEIMKKMEKICVAPGEGGGFNNWGKDIFLEEKCFPEHFFLRHAIGRTLGNQKKTHFTSAVCFFNSKNRFY